MARRLATKHAAAGDWPSYLDQRAKTAQYPPLAKFFAAARKGKEDTPHEEQSREIIINILRGLSTSDLDARIGL